MLVEGAVFGQGHRHVGGSGGNAGGFTPVAGAAAPANSGAGGGGGGGRGTNSNPGAAGGAGGSGYVLIAW